eukprot:scaffold395271_cov48-Prasinocladus_malaysianus.AAC.1
MKDTAGLPGPKDHCVIRRPRSKNGPIGGPCQGIHGVLMACENLRFVVHGAVRIDGPNPYSVIRGAGRQKGAIGRECHSIHGVFVLTIQHHGLRAERAV